MRDDYYKILEVHPEAGTEIVEKTYRTLAMRYHPDRHRTGRKDWAEEKFKKLTEAYAVLSDPVRRREYDREHFSRPAVSERSERIETSPHDEEAYHQYRLGLQHEEKAKCASSLDILLGKTDEERKKAKTLFERVIQTYPKSKYAEDAFYHWLKILNDTPDYSEAFLKKSEEAFEEFGYRYPNSPWLAEAKLEFVRFWLFKRKDAEHALRIIRELQMYEHNADFMSEVRTLTDYALTLKKQPPKTREKVYR